LETISDSKAEWVLLVRPPCDVAAIRNVGEDATLAKGVMYCCNTHFSNIGTAVQTIVVSHKHRAKNMI
jgi:hypothetical protein